MKSYAQWKTKSHGFFEHIAMLELQPKRCTAYHLACCTGVHKPNAILMTVLLELGLELVLP